MSSLDTRRILGSTARLSWISSGFAWLLRFDDGVTEGVAGMGDEGLAEGIKTRLDPFPPIDSILNVVTIGIVSSDLDAVLAGLSVTELEGLDGGSVEIIGDTSDVFEFIIHVVSFISPRRHSIFYIVVDASRLSLRKPNSSY